MDQFAKVKVIGSGDSWEGWYLGIGHEGRLLVVSPSGEVVSKSHTCVKFVVNEYKAAPCDCVGCFTETARGGRQVRVCVKCGKGEDIGPARTGAISAAAIDFSGVKPGQTVKVQWPGKIAEGVNNPELIKELATVAFDQFNAYAFQDPWPRVVIAVLKRYLARPLSEAEFLAACEAYLSACTAGDRGAFVDQAGMRAALHAVFAILQKEIAPRPPEVLDGEALDAKYEDRE